MGGLGHPLGDVFVGLRAVRLGADRDQRPGVTEVVGVGLALLRAPGEGAGVPGLREGVDVQGAGVDDGQVVVGREPRAAAQRAARANLRGVDGLGEDDLLAGVAAVLVGVGPVTELRALVAVPVLVGDGQGVDGVASRIVRTCPGERWWPASAGAAPAVGAAAVRTVRASRALVASAAVVLVSSEGCPLSDRTSSPGSAAALDPEHLLSPPVQAQHGSPDHPTASNCSTRPVRRRPGAEASATGPAGPVMSATDR